MDPLHPIPSFEDAKPAKKRGDPAFETIASISLERFETAGILTSEQRKSYVSLLRGRVSLSEDERNQWYSETLRSIAEMLRRISLGKWQVFPKPLPDHLEEERFAGLKRELIFGYSEYIRKMLHKCAEANLDDYEVVPVGGQEPLLPISIKPRAPKRSTTLPNMLVPLHLFFKQRRWLFGEHQQIMDDLERVLMHVWKKEHPDLTDTEGMRAIPLCNQIWQLIHHEDFSSYTRNWKEQAVPRLKELCKTLSQVDFNSRHFAVSSDSAKPFVIQAGAERNPGSLARHLHSWMHENEVASVFKEAPAYPALIEKLYQRARSLLEGMRLHDELVFCTELWQMSGLKAPLDVTYRGIFTDCNCPIASYQALVMSKSSPLFKPWNTKADKRVQVPLTKKAFDALYAAFIKEWPQHDCDSILAVFKPARQCQMDQFLNRLFRDLKFCLARCSTLQDLSDLENRIQRLDCFDAACRSQWQKERDNWISNWLNKLSDEEEKQIKNLSQVRSLYFDGVHPRILAFLAQLPELEELEIDTLPDLSQLDETPFSKLQSLTITSEMTHCDNLAQWLARPSLNKLTITLQNSGNLEYFLRLIPATVALHLRIAKPLQNADALPLANCTSLASLDFICPTLNPFQEMLKAIPELKLRVVGQHADASELQHLQHLPSVRLLELRESWGSLPGIWEALPLQLEILCLGRTASRHLITSAVQLPKLRVLELQLTSDEIATLPRKLPHPVGELTIRLQNNSFQEMALMDPLFIEKFHLIGKWSLGPLECTEFYVLKQQERAVFFLSGKSADEAQIVNEILASAFTHIAHITLHGMDRPSSQWIMQKDGKFELLRQI